MLDFVGSVILPRDVNIQRRRSIGSIRSTVGGRVIHTVFINLHTAHPVQQINTLPHILFGGDGDYEPTDQARSLVYLVYNNLIACYHECAQHLQHSISTVDFSCCFC